MDFDTFKAKLFHTERYPITVRIDETDPYGVVNNAEYYGYFENGRLVFLQAIGVSAECFLADCFLEYTNIKYIAALRFSDRAEIVTKLKRVDETTIEFDQVLISGKNGQTVAKSTSIYRCQKGTYP